MEIQSIDDTNEDGPVYGGPVVKLPPDLNVGAMIAAAGMPKPWHYYDWIKSKVWPVATGRGIKVAVLDTGYKKHRFGPEPIAAKSFVNGQSWVDGNGHGTHCAGSILCRRDENGDSIGIAPDAELIVGKVLSNQGSGGSDGIAAGIRWAADQGADIISMSLGGGSSHQPTNEAIDYAWSKGCWVFAAAGNSGYKGANTIGWPGKYENCICTASYQEDGTISNFSSGGREVDWACPGSNIVSFGLNDNWQLMSGTSMATPQGVGRSACVRELMMRQGMPIFTSARQLLDYFTVVLKDAGAIGDDVRFGKGKADADYVLGAIVDGLTAA